MKPVRISPIVLLLFIVGALVAVTPSLARLNGNATDPVPVAWNDGRVFVTRSAPFLAGCEAGRVAGTISRAWTTFNRGKVTAMMTFFARQAGAGGRGFSVFSSGEPNGRITLHTRSATARYLSARYQSTDRFHLVLLEATPEHSSTISIYFTFAVVSRPSGSDTEELSRVDGKASINCPNRSIFLWVMSPKTPFPDDPSAVAANVCPLPANWQLGDGAIACTRSG